MKPLIICFIAGILAGGLLVYKFFTPESKPVKVSPVEIIKESEPIIKYKYKYVAVQNDINKLRECYKSPIKLDYNISNYNMNVRAWDDCKETSQVIKLEVARSGNWKFYVGAGVAIGAGTIYLAYKYLK